MKLDKDIWKVIFIFSALYSKMSNKRCNMYIYIYITRSNYFQRFFSQGANGICYNVGEIVLIFLLSNLRFISMIVKL